jgi:hypothetical protein
MPGTEPRLSKRVEGFIAVPSVDIVAVVSLPPGQVRDTAHGWLIEPADLGANLVVLLSCDTGRMTWATTVMGSLE